MKAELIKIGNSRGLRIPSTILKQCGMNKKVNLTVEDHRLIITPCEEARLGWENDFKHMAHNDDDLPLDSDITDHSWDDEEWQW